MLFQELLKLPQDVVSGESNLTMIGTGQIRIENYRSILIYSDTMIKVQGRNYKIRVEGRRLCIRYYDKDEMEIVGAIGAVVFEA